MEKLEIFHYMLLKKYFKTYKNTHMFILFSFMILS